MGQKAELNKLIAQAMPGVVQLVKTKRQEMGDAHVTECVRRGLAGEPGWFFAREGALAVGTPWTDDGDIERVFGLQVSLEGTAFVLMRPVPVVVS
jgi:hypothetical protein